METLKNIPVNIKENRPHLLLSVPSLARTSKECGKGYPKRGFAEKLRFALKLPTLITELMEQGKGFRILLKP
jgi:long-chain acyl-CoA synthetase